MASEDAGVPVVVRSGLLLLYPYTREGHVPERGFRGPSDTTHLILGGPFGRPPLAHIPQGGRRARKNQEIVLSRGGGVAGLIRSDSRGAVGLGGDSISLARASGEEEDDDDGRAVARGSLGGGFCPPWSRRYIGILNQVELWGRRFVSDKVFLRPTRQGRGPVFSLACFVASRREGVGRGLGKILFWPRRDSLTDARRRPSRVSSGGRFPPPSRSRLTEASPELQVQVVAPDMRLSAACMQLVAHEWAETCRPTAAAAKSSPNASRWARQESVEPSSPPSWSRDCRSLLLQNSPFSPVDGLTS